MIRLVAIIIITGIAIQLFSKHLVFVDYLINKSYISSVLCEKKSVPNNHCEGQCQLKKQLQKESEREQSSPQNTSKSGADIQFTLHEASPIAFSVPFLRDLFYDYKLALPNGFLPGIFHPPSC